MSIFRAKNKFSRILERTIITVAVIVLATVAVKAFDKYSNPPAGEQAGDSPCPEEMVYIDNGKNSFCVDRYEASAGESCPISNPASQSDSNMNLAADGCRPNSQAGAVPWRMLSQSQAIEACAKAGKRLPTSEEWYLAALGTPDHNTGWTSDDCQLADNWDAQPGFTGSGKNCKSAAGAYDMVGNVWEWVKEESRDGSYNGIELPDSGYITTVDTAGMPAATDPNQPDENYNNDYFWIKQTGLRGMLRGGYWDNGADAGKYSVYLVLPPSYAGETVGFRCVK